MSPTTFRGPDALAAFLNPDNHVTPLVELPPVLNPYHDQRVRIFVKLMAFLPLGNVKSLPAYSMLENAHQTGRLEGVHTLVESSSGNTVFSAGVVARAVYGINSTVALASNEVEPGKLRLLRLFGTEIEVIEEDICPDPEDPESGINQAKRRGATPGFYNPGQYDNDANPNAHMRWTGPQIWEQTEGKVTLLCAGLGTTGTLVGTSQYLKEQSPTLSSIGVVRVPNNPVPGVRTESLLKEIAFPWRKYVDHLHQIGTGAAYKASMRLCREGLMAGPSSGFAYAGLLEFLEAKVQEGTLDLHRNSDGEVVAVFIAPDSPLPYLEEYERYLEDDAFPPLRNAHLLRYQAQPEKETTLPDLADIRSAELDVDTCLSYAYGQSAETLREQVRVGIPEEALLRKEVRIIDLRTPREFADHHLPGALRVEHQIFSEHLASIFVPRLKSAEKVVLVCSIGVQSTSLAVKARSLGLLNTFSLQGGTMEWSRRNLPRIRPSECDSTCAES